MSHPRARIGLAYGSCGPAGGGADSYDRPAQRSPMASPIRRPGHLKPVNPTSATPLDSTRAARRAGTIAARVPETSTPVRLCRPPEKDRRILRPIPTAPFSTERRLADVIDRLRAALADRYAITREIGAGGMATVYLAEDLRHHRKVAVKVLDPSSRPPWAPSAFCSEIEVAAQLQHPNILPLLDSGDSDGFLYYVMPFIAGRDAAGAPGAGG